MRSASTRARRIRICSAGTAVGRCAEALASAWPATPRRKGGCPRGFLWCRLRFASALATVSCRARLHFYTPWIGASLSLQVSRRLRQAHSIPDIIPTRVSGPAPVRRSRLCRVGLWPSARRTAHRSVTTGRCTIGRAKSACPVFRPQSPPSPSPHRRIVFWRIVWHFAPYTPVSRARTVSS